MADKKERRVKMAMEYDKEFGDLLEDREKSTDISKPRTTVTKQYAGVLRAQTEMNWPEGLKEKSSKDKADGIKKWKR